LRLGWAALLYIWLETNACIYMPILVEKKDDRIQAISADFSTGIIGGKGAIIIIFESKVWAFTFVFDIVVHSAKVLEQEVVNNE
jgi:hypothetical protein